MKRWRFGLFPVRPLGEEDVEAIYRLSRGNELFYRYHPPMVTRESIRADMAALPPGKGYEDKRYVGFFDRDNLVAVLDFIWHYPEEGAGWIGLFMVHPDRQGCGVGSAILQDCLLHWRRTGLRRICLAVDHGNPQSAAFWRKNGFRVTGEGTYIQMEHTL